MSPQGRHRILRHVGIALADTFPAFNRIFYHHLYKLTIFTAHLPSCPLAGQTKLCLAEETFRKRRRDEDGMPEARRITYIILWNAV